MYLSAEQIIERIAPNEQAMLDSLFNPVTFSDGTKGTYSGYIVKSLKTCVKFAWLGHKELFVSKHGVIGQWSKLNDGTNRTWYSYVLDPFGKDVPYSVECEASQLIKSKFLKGIKNV